MSIKNNYSSKVKSALDKVRVKKLPILVSSFVFISFVSLFLITRGVTPHTSELSYIEHSVLGKSSGSVIPASCDSKAPHDGEVCGTWVAGQCPAWNDCSATTQYVNFVCSNNSGSGCFGPQPNPILCKFDDKPCKPDVDIKLGGQQAAIAPVPPPIETFQASPTYVPWGETTKIDVKSTAASRCLLTVSENGVQLYQTIIWYDTVAKNDPFITNPNDSMFPRTRTYTVQCSNRTGQITNSAPIQVYFEELPYQDPCEYYGGYYCIYK
jgi:hypothetical protein